MRAAALLALGACAAVGRADEDAASAASVIANMPTFTPTVVKAPFFEQFEDDSRWKASHAKKENTDEEWQYVGTWNVEEPHVFPGIKGDKGLVLKDQAAHHAISAKFDKPINNKGETLVVQYEVKFQSGLECGGAYMKLLQESAALGKDEFSNASPYIIMFGPDRCGSTNKVHFIFRHKNPKTGEYEEKHLTSAPAAQLQKTSALYTLIVRPDQTFEVRVDGEIEREGSLLEEFDPPVNPDKEIDDPTDSKPDDWVDSSMMDDPDAVKPADWDEEAPFEIIDDEAEKPADWLENEPERIPDPEAVKPEDWDDEEDGDWIAPLVSNPKCDEVSGCGEWTKPLKRNPNYKGKWQPPRIDNPAYKGIWAPRKIANPDFFEDLTPSNFEPMGAIGFELWTMQNDILFDNIYIGHSVADAERIKAETFDVKNKTEKAAEAAAKPADPIDDDPTSPNDLSFTADPVKYVTEKSALFIELAKRNPMDAVTHVPEIAAALGVGLVTLLLAIVGLAGGATAAAPSKAQVDAKAQQAKDAANKTKEQVASAVASGAEKAKDEVNKRTTRSS